MARSVEKTGDTLEAQVFAFVAQETGRRLRDLTLQTTLLGDLGVDGDDGDELLVAFMQRFSVDMTPFHFDRHFGSEGLPLWAPLYWLLLWWRAVVEKGSTPESCARLIPIAISDLVDSAKAGKWSIRYGEAL